MNRIWKLMPPMMAGRAKCDQVIQCIVAELAPLCLMMDVQVNRRTTILTPPPITFEHSVAKQIVFFDAELPSGSLLAKLLHRLL